MRGLILTAALFASMFVFLTPAEAARPLRSISMPAISADGATVYFGCWGDIWAAPRDGSTPARRLTDNMANDARPIPSPDGKWLAFYSDRFGNADIFVMSVDGGKATRITYDSGYDYPYGWNADSSAVLFYSRRSEGWGYSCWEAYLDGHTPVRLTAPDYNDHVNGRWMPDGKTIVYARGPGDWAKKRYHGSGTYDIWTVNTETGEHTQWTDYDGKDLWPMPGKDGRTVFFVSDRDGTENLWRLNTEDGKLAQVTWFTGDGPRWPQISPDGDELAFEVFGELYVKDVAGGRSEKINILFADDTKLTYEYTTDFNNNINEYALSPNGNYFAVAVFGDIYLLKNPDKYEESEEPDQDLSRTRPLVTSQGRDMGVTWHPKSTKIAYMSDRDGQFDIYLLDLQTMAEKRLTTTPEEETSPTFAPKGNTLAYYSGTRRIMTYDLDTDEEQVLYEGQVKWGPRGNGFAWAPDGYWMAVNDYILDYQREIYFVNIADREPIQVTHNATFSGGAAWSPDGKWFAYALETDIGADVMLVELNPEEETYDLDLLFPEDQPEEPEAEPAVAEDEGAEGAPAGDDASAAVADDEDAADDGTGDAEGDEEDEDAAKLEPLTINFDRIHLRGFPVSEFNGNAYGPFFDPESEYIVFTTDHTGDNDYWTVSVDGETLERLGGASGKGNPQFTADGKRIYFQEGDRVTYWDMSGQSASGGGGVGFRTRVDYDQYAIWEQVMVEGWRVLKFGFYDPTMNGVDWDEVIARYLPRVSEVGTPEEFGALYREMLGELGGSHLGYNSNGDSREAPADNTGDLGVVYDESFAGPGWRIARVYKDGPADAPGVKLVAGDLITHVNGVELDGAENRARLLNNTIGQPVEISVALGEASLAQAREADPDNEPEPTRELVIKPTSQGGAGNMRYEAWVDDTRTMVDELSEGRIGYLHIAGMDDPSAQRFFRELFGEYHDKEALIVDVRFNGGGYTAVDVLNILDEQPAYWRAPRDEADWNYGRQFVWQGPIVVLTNSSSFSNAEIFAHIMQDLGLATVLGEATPGGVISTSTWGLMDGSSIRIPARGNWRLNGVDMEGNGCQPGIEVIFDPNLYREGRDNQVEAGVEFLLGEL